MRADLQVHTPADGRFRFPGPVPASDEERLELATAYLTRARERGIGLVAITEHDDVSWIPILRTAAAEVGIALMPGFEVESGEGVHVLCLFDHDVPMADLERALAATLAPAVGRRAREHGPVRLPFADLIDTVQDGHGGVCIAAHVYSEKGLRGALSGRARQRAWAHEGLLAVQVGRAPRRGAGTAREDEDAIDRRGRRPARVLTSDSRTLDAIGTVATQLKLDGASAAALRQAFLDPDSRIAYGERPPPSGGSGARLLAVECDGGFLHEVRFGFGDQLTCVIGRSGTGKSALVEALRAGLGAGFACERAEREAGALAAETFGGGAKLALAVEAGGERHLLEYAGGGAATVFGADGVAREGVEPAGLVGARVYGQGELAAIAADPRAQLALLDMAAGGGSDAAGRRAAAERIDAALDGIVRIKLHADDRIEIALNIALPERRRKYRPLDGLAPGQRQAATLAVLLEVLAGEGGGGDGDAGGRRWRQRRRRERGPQGRRRQPRPGHSRPARGRPRRALDLRHRHPPPARHQAHAPAHRRHPRPQHRPALRRRPDRPPRNDPAGPRAPRARPRRRQRLDRAHRHPPSRRGRARRRQSGAGVARSGVWGGVRGAPVLSQAGRCAGATEAARAAATSNRLGSLHLGRPSDP